VNHELTSPDYVIKNGDLIENTMHRHEPPVVGVPVKVLHRDEERGLFVVEKPGSMPVCGFCPRRPL
jgi:tRNA pseudouridine synthase 9